MVVVRRIQKRSCIQVDVHTYVHALVVASLQIESGLAGVRLAGCDCDGVGVELEYSWVFLIVFPALVPRECLLYSSATRVQALSFVQIWPAFADWHGKQYLYIGVCCAHVLGCVRAARRKLSRSWEMEAFTAADQPSGSQSIASSPGLLTLPDMCLRPNALYK